MKKLFSLFAVVLMASSMMAQYDTWSVVGSKAIMNGTADWAITETANDMATEDGVTYTLTVTGKTLEVGTTYEYKYAKGHAWTVSVPQSGNLSLTVAETAVYDIVYTVNVSDKTHSAVATKAGEAGEITHVYSIAGSSAELFGASWNQTATATEMVKGEDGIYSWTREGVELAAATIEYKVVVDHAWGEAYPAQNAKLVIAEAATYNVVVTFNPADKAVNATANKVGGEPGPGPEPEPEAENVTFIVTVPEGTKVCYIAGNFNGWSFAEMTAGEGVYTYTTVEKVLADTLEYKYLSGADWKYVEVREADANRTYAAADEVSAWKETYDPEAPVVEATWTVVGVSALFSSEWTPAAEAYDMTKQEDGSWTLTLTDVELSAGNYDYKVAKNHTWDVSLPAKGNNSLTIAENGIYTITFTLDAEETTLSAVAEKTGEPEPEPEPEAENVTFIVTVPEGTKACYIAGNFNGWSFAEMTVGDGVYTYTTEDKFLADTLQYKYLSGAGWKYVEVREADANRTYAAADEVSAWKETYDPEAPVVEATWTVVGGSAPFTPIWDPEADAYNMTKQEDGTWTLTLSEVELSAGNIEYKAAKNHTWEVSVPGKGNNSLTIAENGIYTITFTLDAEETTLSAVAEKTGEPEPEPEAENVIFTVTVPEGTKACYIAGNFNGWSFAEMTVGDGVYTYTTEDKFLADTLEYKYLSGADWKYVEVREADANRTYAAADEVSAWTSEPESEPEAPEYGIMIDGETFVAAVKNEEYVGEGEEWVVSVTFEGGELFQIYNKTTEAGWVIAQSTFSEKVFALTEKDDNFVVADAGEYTLYIKIIYNADEMYVAYNDPSVKHYDYYLVGTAAVDGWDVTKAMPMENDEITRSLEAGTYEFKIINATIIAGEDPSWSSALDYDDLNKECSSEGVEGSSNVKFTLKEAGDVTIKVVEGTICVTGNFGEVVITVYTIAGQETLMGVDWKVDATENDLTKGEDGLWRLMKTDVELMAETYYYFKVVANHAWGVADYPATDANLWLMPNSDGVYDLEFVWNAEESNMDVNFTWKRALPTTYLEMLMQDGAVKVLRGGNLYIIREGKIYNAAGLLVK